MAQVLQGMEDTECSFLTLTMRKTKYPKSIDFINAAWRKWLKRVQRGLGQMYNHTDKQGKIIPLRFDWVKIIEIQRNGQPHIHAIVKKPAEWFQNETVIKWNPRKNKNEIWLKETDWKLKHWQEVIKDGKTKIAALNPVRTNEKDQISSAAELSKYLSKAKSKETKTRNRWYSFSRDFRGCRAELKSYGAIHDQSVARGRCTSEGKCGCERLCIAWDFKHFGSVFINNELMQMMVSGG